jgi:hypothetical protein
LIVVLKVVNSANCKLISMEALQVILRVVINFGERDSLTIGERLLKWGFKGYVMCLFCRSCIEGRDIMFFSLVSFVKEFEGRL